MTLAQFPEVVFYGRLGDQALQMFNLSAELPELRGRRVLDCPGGPGSLPALLRSHGVEVTAVDPLYAMSAAELRNRAAADLDLTIELSDLFQSLRPDFDLAGLRREHLDGLEQFLADFSSHPDTYVAASLPDLPFADASFELVLSGHLLFSYAPIKDGGLMAGDGLDLAWHRKALAELCRVSSASVRLYPAHTMQRPVARHAYAEALLADLPSGWSGRFVASSYDQGFVGCCEGLELVRAHR